MRARSIVIHEAFQIKDLTDKTMYELVQWVHSVSGGNVLTDRHGSHVHVRAKGLEFELYENTTPIWLLCSDGNFFAFTDAEFQSSYEVIGSPIADREARVAVQNELFVQNSTMGTVYQALVNSGLNRDQALDGLSEIMKTGVRFAEKSEIARARIFADLSPNCTRCWPGMFSNQWPHQNHETAEHDQWAKQYLNQEMNDE